VEPDTIIHSDGWRGYDGLVVNLHVNLTRVLH